MIAQPPQYPSTPRQVKQSAEAEGNPSDTESCNGGQTETSGHDEGHDLVTLSRAQPRQFSFAEEAGKGLNRTNDQCRKGLHNEGRMLPALNDGRAVSQRSALVQLSPVAPQRPPRAPAMQLAH